ncbi:MAG: flavodoxin family protein [Peptococcaceae bacterium]|nr:flavodoxin family protein [Peptococcaceae bacterium]
MPGQLCVGLACSPRKNGNTDILLQRSVKTMRDLDVDTEIIYLADLKFSPCRACEGCHTTGRCVIKDEAGPVFEKVLRAEIIILAAPVFSMGLCAQAKMFIDRAQQFWAARYILGRPVVEDARLRKARRGLFISCAGTELPGVFDGPIRVARYFFKLMDIRLAGTHCYSGVDKKGEILTRAGALEEITASSAKLASSPFRHDGVFPQNHA